jgi:hypothetical protein
MDDFEEEETDEEIAEGSEEYMKYLEECDSKECVYTWGALMESSMLLYNFRKVV